MGMTAMVIIKLKLALLVLAAGSMERRVQTRMTAHGGE
jgi:hypothetical protein